ncbi:transposase [Alloprevotella sp. OH1205_COT-284]|uniref:transposase n=1 Tax=Alloprevotella sp. OH1205_COT-284 TaxID=2491043 RepID=UPI000F5D9EFA|nr:transposase [Alloprevotella sp. OH1205_COT-284]RRD75949.1 transposase [Alloprevotella sp. OH1205_COT-284]
MYSFAQINQLIDRKPLARLIEKVYTQGSSSTRRFSYEGILFFKIELLRTWHGLSDPEVEEQIKGRLSFMRFWGLS